MRKQSSLYLWNLNDQIILKEIELDSFKNNINFRYYHELDFINLICVDSQGIKKYKLKDGNKMEIAISMD